MTAVDITRLHGRPAAAPMVVASGTLEALKWLALVLMTLDHANKYLFAAKLSPFMFELGRVSLPLFAFVLGYNMARSDMADDAMQLRAIKRLALWGAIATVPYIALGTAAFGWWPLNILLTFLVVVVVARLMQMSGIAYRALAVLTFCVGGAFVEYWWPAIGLCLAWWAYCRHPSTWRLVAVVGTCAALWVINRNWWALVAIPIALGAPFVNVELQRRRLLFYAYYPAHLAALWALRASWGTDKASNARAFPWALHSAASAALFSVHARVHAAQPTFRQGRSQRSRRMECT